MSHAWKDKMKYWWTIFYCPLYFLCYTIVERVNQDVTIVSIAPDYKIPFIEAFIIPYLMWFPYVILTFFIFFFKDKEEFLQFIKYLYMGMTVFIVVSFLFPNGLDIRPAFFERDNIFIHMVQWIYGNDTATNVVPSIHAYNSIVIMIAAIQSKKVIDKRWQKVLCCVISILIVLSTVFVKQHSVIDVLAAIVLAWVGYKIYYAKEVSVLQKAKALIQN